MDSLNLAVLQACSAWQQAGHEVQLVTVVKTWGSSPRPEGATMAIRGDGLVVGSVSGGCIEDDLIARARATPQARPTEVLSYGISADEAHRFGLPCGGTVVLVVERLGAHSRMDELLARMQQRQLTRRLLALDSGAVQLVAADPQDQLSLNEQTLQTVHGPRWRLLIIGAGQLSQFLAGIAAALDFHVTVCDPREEYRLSWSLPGVEVVHAMPDDYVQELRLDRRSAVVALTHDPKLDDLALMEALASEAFYVGAIGSRLNQARRRERLRLFDLSEAQISRLRAPIGLDIGSKTPDEIAIAILAELIAFRNGLAPAGRSIATTLTKEGST